MERKLVRQGRGALTVTLPADWLKAKGLHQGHTVNVTPTSKSVVITPGIVSEKKKITLHVENQDPRIIWHTIMAKYIEGYDVITIHHTNAKVVQEVIQNMIGMLVEEHMAKKTVARSIVSIPEENFHAVFRRAGHILVQLANALVALAESNIDREQLKAYEELLDKNVLYCLRYLHKYTPYENTQRQFLLCATFEAAGDALSQMSKHIGKNVMLAKGTSRIINVYVNCLFKKDFTQLYRAITTYRSNLNTKTFVEGLAFSLSETIYNYLGYLLEN